MKWKIVFSGIFILLLIGFVSADLCKGDSGYYNDCGYVSYDFSEGVEFDGGDEMVRVESREDKYENCIDICFSKYSSYQYRRSDRLRLRAGCFEDCKVDKSYSEEIKHIEIVEDKGNYISASFEDSVVIEDSYSDFYGEDNYEYIFLDKREYEVEKRGRYGGDYSNLRDAVYVYVPYDSHIDDFYEWKVEKKKKECDFWCWLGF